jgi:hypothetical protein
MHARTHAGSLAARARVAEEGEAAEAKGSMAGGCPCHPPARLTPAIPAWLLQRRGVSRTKALQVLISHFTLHPQHGPPEMSTFTCTARVATRRSSLAGFNLQRTRRPAARAAPAPYHVAPASIHTASLDIVACDRTSAIITNRTLWRCNGTPGIPNARHHALRCPL